MSGLFYAAALVALVATGLALTRVNAVHAVLYLIVSLLAVAVVFYVLGAPFAAALEVITYAGAIMVLFVFIVMLLPARQQVLADERALLPRFWFGPAILAAIVAAELITALCGGSLGDSGPAVWIGPRGVAVSLFGPYLLGLELASFLLLAALVGAFHLAAPGPSPAVSSGPAQRRAEP